MDIRLNDLKYSIADSKKRKITYQKCFRNTDTPGEGRIPYRIHIRYGYTWDTPGIRIQFVSTYPWLIGLETKDWIRFGAVDTAQPNFPPSNPTPDPSLPGSHAQRVTEPPPPLPPVDSPMQHPPPVGNQPPPSTVTRPCDGDEALHPASALQERAPATATKVCARLVAKTTSPCDG